MEELMRTGELLLLGFVRDRLQQCEDPEARELGRAALGGPQEWSPQTQKLGELLRRVGDELDGNVELQRMISQVSCLAPREVFFRVAKEMFADDNFNWGRVVALFYFACKLIIKALCTRLPQVVQTLLAWTGQFLREHILAWIKAQGGWDALLSAFGPPTWRNVTISAAIIITASFTLWRMA